MSAASDLLHSLFALHAQRVKQFKALDAAFRLFLQGKNHALYDANTQDVSRELSAISLQVIDLGNRLRALAGDVLHAAALADLVNELQQQEKLKFQLILDYQLAKKLWYDSQVKKAIEEEAHSHSHSHGHSHGHGHGHSHEAHGVAHDQADLLFQGEYDDDDDDDGTARNAWLAQMRVQGAEAAVNDVLAELQAELADL